jgi:carbon storage regulator
MIGDDIELTVVDIRGDKVRLGINAPAHVPVHRKEIYDAIKRENEQAARLNIRAGGSLPAAARFPKAERPDVNPVPTVQRRSGPQSRHAV